MDILVGQTGNEARLTVVPENQKNPEPVVHLPEVLVLGVGSGGVATIAFIIEALQKMTSGIEALEVVAVDSDARTLLTVSKYIKTVTIDPSGWGSGGDQARAARMVENNKKIFEEMFEKRDLIVLVTGLGGGTGSGASTALIKLAKEAGVRIVVMAQAPLSAENRAEVQTTLKEIHREAAGVCVVPTDPVFKILSEVETVASESFDVVHRAIGHRLLSLLSIVLGDSKNGQVIDIRDILACMTGKTVDGEDKPLSTASSSEKYQTFYVGVPDSIQSDSRDNPKDDTQDLAQEFHKILHGYFSRYTSLKGAIHSILINVVLKKDEKLTTGEIKKLTEVLHEFTDTKNPPSVKFGTMSFETAGGENILPRICVIATLEGTADQVLFPPPRTEKPEDGVEEKDDSQTAAPGESDDLVPTKWYERAVNWLDGFFSHKKADRVKPTVD